MIHSHFHDHRKTAETRQTAQTPPGCDNDLDHRVALAALYDDEEDIDLSADTIDQLALL